jgi:DNA repair exonuclease SbcCD ATPase subunit
LLFLNSIIYPQDNVDNFVKQSAARRKEIILEIVSASDYDEYYEKARDKVRELETMIGGSEVAIAGITNKLKGDRENLPLLSLAELTIEFNNAEADTKSKKGKLETALDKESEIDSITSKMSDKNKDLTDVYDKAQKLIVEIGNLNQKKEVLLTIDVDALKENIENKKSELTGFRELTIKVNTWNVKMLELINSAPVDIDYKEIEIKLNLQIINLLKKDIEICPEINKACPIIVRERDLRVTELSNTLNETTKEKKIYTEKKVNYNKMVDALGEKPKIDNVEFSELELLTERLEKKLKEVEQGTIDTTIEISVKEKELKTFGTEENKLKNELETLRLKLDELKIKYPEENLERLTKGYDDSISRNQELSQTIAVTKNNIERIEKEEERLKSMKKNIKDDQDILKSMKLLKEAFGNNGIKAIVIDYVIPRLEDKINAILGELSSFRVCLDTQRKGINEDRTKEGLFIDIINDNGEILDFGSYSGGEKMKINMAIFEALASLSHVNFRIFDETFFALDQESSEKFLSVIKEITKNVSQFVCISHISNIKDFFPEKINVIKINGDSSIN